MPWPDRIGRRIKLRDLHVLHAVVQSGSMTKAARDLAISVPVVSKAIAELEHAVGVPLLDRSPQGSSQQLTGVRLSGPLNLSRIVVVEENLGHPVGTRAPCSYSVPDRSPAASSNSTAMRTNLAKLSAPIFSMTHAR
jgi:molybdenum-dependent DNA-binding transcriptional regulator ModE